MTEIDENTIQQIIPAPPGLMAVCDNGLDNIYLPVIAIALDEDTGEKCITYLVQNERKGIWTELEYACCMHGFKGYIWRDEIAVDRKADMS